LSETAAPEKHRATAEMVAKAARVSRVAVSRAFNPGASLKAEKRERILKIASELNYTPDRAARALVTRRSHLVGVIVPDVCSPWESQEIDALTTALQAAGFATLLFKTRIDLSMDETLLTYMKGFNLDSIIAYAENVTPETLSRVLDRAVPIYVTYDQWQAGDSDGTGLLYDRLNVHQHEGIEQAVALLHGYGVKKLAYLTGKAQSRANAARLATLSKVMAARGMAPPILCEGDFSYDRAHAAVLDLFKFGERPDAIFAANDEGAFGALDVLRFELGLRVPEDVKVIGFDDINQSHWRSYNLTTVKVDLDLRIKSLIRLILRRLQQPDAPPMIEHVPTRLVVRGTVG
jgi:DNA-binding LacI/PurR family transcriptional regulator